MWVLGNYVFNFGQIEFEDSEEWKMEKAWRSCKWRSELQSRGAWRFGSELLASRREGLAPGERTPRSR